MYSHQNKPFWNRCNVAWPHRLEPSGSRTVLTKLCAVFGYLNSTALDHFCRFRRAVRRWLKMPASRHYSALKKQFDYRSLAWELEACFCYCAIFSSTYSPPFHCLAGHLALGTSPSAKTNALVSLVNMRKNNGLVPENNRALVFGLKLFPFTLKSRDTQCLAFLYITRSFTICTCNLISCCGASAQIRPRPPPFEALQMTHKITHPEGLLWTRD